MDTPTTLEPEQPSRGARLAKAGALVAAGALAATAITGIAFAANSPSPAPEGAARYGAPLGGPGGMGLEGGMGGGMGGMGGGLGAADAAAPGFGGGRHRGGAGMMLGGPLLHGEGVVKKQDGTFLTVRMQTGALVSSTASEVVVKSEDGTTWTWPVTKDTKVVRNGAATTADKLVAGDEVRVGGTVSGGTVTTLHVRALDAAKAKDLKAQREAMRQQRAQGNGAAPKASPSTTA
jgi:major membrane immunogen (membrane-anchored lipoprotein)